MLSLKRTETSTVRQSFSHGRSKAVVVEKKRARIVSGKVSPKKEKETVHAAPGAGKPATEQPRDSAAAIRGAARAGVVLRELTDDEKEARTRALTDAKVAEKEARKQAETEAQHRAVEEVRVKREHDAAEKRKTEEEARKATDDEARRHAEQEAMRRLEMSKAAGAAPEVAPAPDKRSRVQEAEEEGAGRKGKVAPKTPSTRKTPGGRRTGKLTIARALSGDDERMRSLASFRRQLSRAHRQTQAPPADRAAAAG